ncbi:translation initiation factor IF-2-like [Prionailurus viverrinus]|uniref:translation initiation factor IF-2-like n=1 Tax=Prionailurus viverrinus TaxID=61388 RepID=UPI001FF5F0A5|nr:translation initiation factor IF-2-like [Prionailurus viverrinus]
MPRLQSTTPAPRGGRCRDPRRCPAGGEGEAERPPAPQLVPGSGSALLGLYAPPPEVASPAVIRPNPRGRTNPRHLPGGPPGLSIRSSPGTRGTPRTREVLPAVVRPSADTVSPAGHSDRSESPGFTLEERNRPERRRHRADFTSAPRGTRARTLPSPRPPRDLRAAGPAPAPHTRPLPPGGRDPRPRRPGSRCSGGTSEDGEGAAGSAPEDHRPRGPRPDSVQASHVPCGSPGNDSLGFSASRSS